MTDNQRQILNDLYNRYKAGERGASISLMGIESKEKQSILVQLRYLEEKGLIDIYAQAIGFVELRITSDGIDFIENNFATPTASTAIHGENIIYMNGSNNTISNNYNNVAIEINDSDLPDETRLLIETFLNEIKNPILNKESKAEKIKQFLSDLTSGTLSGLATNGLTVLLSSLLSKV